MNKLYLPGIRRVSFAGAICGSLLIFLPGMTREAKANQCPGIYYEEPYNSISRVPTGCPLNDFTRELIQPLVATPEPVAPLPNNTRAIPPLPEERSEPIAYVQPIEGQVSVKLKNNTNALITYEAVSYTQRRSLPGGEEVLLQELPLPVTITTVRQDDGLLKVIPQESESGMLELILEEDPELDDTLSVIRIQEDGQVFVN